MLYTLANFNAFRDFAHNASRSAGWWKGSERYGTLMEQDDGQTAPDRYVIPTKLCLIHSEISEAYDGYMTGANDEHLPEYPSALVEFGDVLLRIGDTAGYLDIDLTSAIMLVLQADHIGWKSDSSFFNSTIRHDGTDYHMPPSWFMLLNCFTSAAMEGFRKGSKDKIIPALPALDANLARIVILCNLIAEKNEWNLPEATAAKAAYNAVRLDHKAETRALKDGKKF